MILITPSPFLYNIKMKNWYYDIRKSIWNNESMSYAKKIGKMFNIVVRKLEHKNRTASVNKQ